MKLLLQILQIIFGFVVGHIILSFGFNQANFLGWAIGLIILTLTLPLAPIYLMKKPIDKQEYTFAALRLLIGVYVTGYFVLSNHL